ncbi:hypothetical protein GJ496_005608 [Pomphorhynchus laevis]|nr:hypothetical protein GJ496_005608 [Pomphorhynchus laevis]
MIFKFLLLLLGTLTNGNVSKFNPENIIFAVNCGGSNLVDSNGVHYSEDTNLEGIAVDIGNRLIARVNAEDQIVYQTERYALNTFSYEFPLKEDGLYILWLKFSEVYFTSSMQKVFHVAINDDVVVPSLDIYSQVDDNELQYDGNIKVSFIKTNLDNPKVNAIIIYKGNLTDIPQLPPYEIPVDNDSYFDDDEEDDMVVEKQGTFKIPSHVTDRSSQNFNDLDDSLEDEMPAPNLNLLSSYVPIAVVVLAAIPVLYFLYRM